MCQKILFIGFLMFGIHHIDSQAQNTRSDSAAISALLDKQTRAWNEGIIDSFMVGYLHTDSLMFIGKKGLTYGYQVTLENYKKGYPDKAGMGTLHFDIKKMKPLGRRFYFVVGKWALTRPEKGDLEGFFSLLLEKIGGEWKIIADHSS